MDIIQTFPNKLFLRHGLLCLDFTNTVFWRLQKEPKEGFQDYTVFVKWSQKVGLLADTAAKQLLREAEVRPDEVVQVLNRVITFREALYRIFATATDGNQPESNDLDLLNVELAKILSRTLLFQKDNKFDWGWRDDENALDQMLWPILYSATELLTSPELIRIGMCAGEGCGWLFYDKSRNRSRKWCDMDDCGNRAKARRFYKRKREQISTNT